MTDIVVRLRKFFHPFTDEDGDPDEEAEKIMNEAADEIERIEADTIEQCAQVAEAYEDLEVGPAIAMLIRKLNDK